MSSSTPQNGTPARQGFVRKIVSSVVALLALVAVVLIVDRFVVHPDTMQFGAAPTVTVTPSVETPTATPEATTEAPAETAETAPAPETEAPVAEPTTAEQAPAPAETEDAPQGVSIVASEGMEGDDYIIRLITPAGVSATQNHAAGVLASKVQELTGTPQAANVDLVAVYSSDGVMVGSDRLPDGKWAS